MVRLSSSRRESGSAAPLMLKYISVGLFSLGLFFSVLFYVYESSLAFDSDEHDTDLYKFLLTLVALSITALIILIYKHNSRFVRMLEYFVVIAIVVIAGLSINQLLKGYEKILDTTADKEHKATLHIYASLMVGFIGTGGLMAMIKNFYMR